MIYTASSLALAALEILVHLPPAMRRAGALPGFIAIAIDLPEGEVAALSPTGDDRADGDAWITQGPSLALRVPSRVIALEDNILINPRHPSVGRVTVALQTPFQFDIRLAP